MNRLLFFNNTETVDSGSAGVTDPSQVVDQQIAIFNADDLSAGTLDLTGANATQKMIFVQGDDKFPFVSQVIDKSAIKRAITKAYQADVNQVTHIGFSGSGSLGITATTGDAYAKVTRLDKGFEKFPRATANVTVLSGDTQYDIANKLAIDFNAKSDAKKFVDADVLVNQASSQLVDDSTGDNVTLDVTYGNNVVLATVNSGEEVDASVGDFIRIGSATALTSPVYEITAIETNGGSQTQLQVTLDRAYAGDTATGVAAGTLDATITTQEAGVELTAQDVDDVDDYVTLTAVVSFSTALSEEFDGTIVAIGTTPKTGSGTFRQARYLERQFAGIMKSFTQRNYFPQTPEYYADDATNYDICTILVDIDNDDAVVKANDQLAISFLYDTGASLSTQLETFFGVS